MSRPPSLILEHRCLKPPPSHSSQVVDDPGHHPEVGVDDTGTVAGGARAFRVGAEERRLHAVGFRECGADRIEQPCIRCRVAAYANRGSCPGRSTPRPRRSGIEPRTSELLPEPATPVTTTSTPSGISTSTSRRLCVDAPRISSAPFGVRGAFRRSARSSRCFPVSVPLVRSLATLPSKQTVPASALRQGRGRRRGRRSRWCPVRAPPPARCCPCPASAAAGRSSARMSCGCRPAVGSSKTYVTSVSEEPRWRIILVRCASPPDKRSGRSVEREISQPDLHEGIERLQQRRRAAARPTVRPVLAPTPPGR